jgi:uncharacterized protein
MNSRLALTEAELAEVRGILTAHLPQGIRVRAFGSRARGGCKPWSDLDLELSGSGPLPIALLAQLAEAFEESTLPWKVDLVDRHYASDAFASVIDGSAVLLEF